MLFYEEYLSLKAEKLTKYRIIKTLGISNSTYYRYESAFKNGIRSSVSRGRKPLLCLSSKIYIRNLIERCKYLTTKEIYIKCQNLGKKSSIGTIRNYLHSFNYFHKKAKKAPLISQRNKNKRMAFCIKNYNLDYKSIVCVDECHFINVPLNGNYYWSKSAKPRIIGVSKKRMDISVFGAISYTRKF